MVSSIPRVLAMLLNLAYSIPSLGKMQEVMYFILSEISQEYHWFSVKYGRRFSDFYMMSISDLAFCCFWCFAAAV